MDREDDERMLEELKIICRERVGHLQNLQSTAFQLANYYFVFQGVILTIICNGKTSLRCSDRWFLFTVSMLAAALNLVALWITGLKYLRTISQNDDAWSDMNGLENRLQTGTLRFAPYKNTDRYNQIKRRIYFCVCMVLFLGFALVTLSGCWHILCRRNESYDQGQRGNNYDAKCIKFCDSGRCLSICNE